MGQKTCRKENCVVPTIILSRTGQETFKNTVVSTIVSHISGGYIILSGFYKRSIYPDVRLTLGIGAYGQMPKDFAVIWHPALNL